MDITQKQELRDRAAEIRYGWKCTTVIDESTRLKDPLAGHVLEPEMKYDERKLQFRGEACEKLARWNLS